MCPLGVWIFFFFNDTATTEIYTLSLHDALPICPGVQQGLRRQVERAGGAAVQHPLEGVGDVVGVDERHRDRRQGQRQQARDRKSTRLNSSHANISYAVFCLKKKHRHTTYSHLWQ